MTGEDMHVLADALDESVQARRPAGRTQHVCLVCKDDPELVGKRPRAIDPASPRTKPHCATHLREIVKARKLGSSARRKAGRYGIGVDEQRELVEFQDGQCPICLSSIVPNGYRKPAVDHDHTCCPSRPTCGDCTRGITCNYCNYTLLGRYDLAALKRAVAYLEDPPLPRMRRLRRELEIAS